jgi:non-ribosomal peptide synthetase component F
MKWDELELEFFEIPQQEGQFDLALEIIESKGSLYGTLKYNMDLFDNKTIVRIAGDFKTLLKMIVAKPELNISELPMLNYVNNIV